MISPDMIEQVAACIASAGHVSGAEAELRARFAPVRFTFCQDDDITASAKPVHEGAGFNIYLVGSGSHCMTLSNIFENAAGVVVAEVGED